MDQVRSSNIYFQINLRGLPEVKCLHAKSFCKWQINKHQNQLKLMQYITT